MLKKTRIVIAALALTWCMGAVVPTQAFADDHHEDKCERRIHDAEAKLQDAIARHGEHSRQAEKRRHDLEDARAHASTMMAIAR